MTGGRRLRPVQWIAVAIAGCWALALLVAACVAPAYDSTSVTSVARSGAAPGSGSVVADGAVTATRTSATLVQENGPAALVIAAVPLLVTLAATWALVRRSLRKSGAGPVAWSLVGLLAAGNVVAMLSIGVFVLPVTAALILACATHPTRPAVHGRADAAMLGG